MNDETNYYVGSYDSSSSVATLPAFTTTTTWPVDAQPMYQYYNYDGFEVGFKVDDEEEKEPPYIDSNLSIERFFLED